MFNNVRQRYDVAGQARSDLSVSLCVTLTGRSSWMNLARSVSVLVAFIGLAYPQTKTAEKPKFEVASVKPNTAGNLGMLVHASTGGRLAMENYPLVILIGIAWDVKGFQISRGPSWINSDRYDITAKADSDLTFDQMRPLLGTLLEDRFKLSHHRETKEASVYELAPAKGGLKLAGPKEGSCVTPNLKNPAPPRPGELFCGGLRMGKGRIAGAGISMTALSGVLSDVLGRQVIDKTGFKGTFDVRLEFAPDESIADAIVGGRLGQGVPSGDSPTPSIFTALQEQLGVRLETAKGPVETFVIDHVERPGEN
jgi:uncharacterized protein (TIGR03435 family)